MRGFRTIVFWLHLVVATIVGAIVVIMSATGVLLTYETQLTYWADTRGIDVVQPGGAELLSAQQLTAAATAHTSGRPTTVRWRSGDKPVEVAFGRDGVVFLNPYTAEVLGDGSARMRGFFRKVTAWHRWLGASGEGRERGKMITGAANLGFLFIVVSGLYLWFPRQLTRAAFNNVLRFRRGLRPKARDFNWHHVIGFWSFVPLFVIVLSATVISYPWASNLVYRLAGEEPPAQGAQAGRNSSNDKAAAPLSGNALLAAVAQAAPDWRTATLQLTPGKSGVNVAVERGTRGQPQKRVQLTLDPATTQVLKAETFHDQTPGRRARSMLRFAHTGEIFGVAGQTVAGLVTAGSLVLAWTGISLALRRLAGWLRRRRRMETVEEAVMEPAA